MLVNIAFNKYLKNAEKITVYSAKSEIFFPVMIRILNI